MIFSDGVRDATGGHDSVQEQLLPLRRHPAPHQERKMTEGQPSSLRPCRMEHVEDSVFTDRGIKQISN